MTLGMPWSLLLIAGGAALGGAVDDLPVWTGDVSWSSQPGSTSRSTAGCVGAGPAGTATG